MSSERKNTKASRLRPKYNMFQNSCYMIKNAWQMKEKKVIVMSLLSAVLIVANNLINLYVTPTILKAVELHVSIGRLAFTIVAFTAGIMLISAAIAYVNENIQYGMITVRMGFVNLLNRKAATTSYPNLDDERFRKLVDKASRCTRDNRSATEDMWRTLKKLVGNIIGFLIYISILAKVQPVLIAVVLVTALVSYLFGNYINGYEYRHRDEEAGYGRRIGYVLKCESASDMAKDIRLFGLGSWLEELYDKSMKLYMDFHRKAENIHICSGIVDIVLTFIRNAFAYMYLVKLVISGGIGVADFVLIFTAVGGFTEWIVGILSGFNTLYRQSLDINTLRECIEYSEPFTFDGGEQPELSSGKIPEIRLDNVSFRYPGSDKETLKNINLTLHPGEKLAVVGLNGAGKTTLIKLMCGFLDPTQGRVLFDGKDIRGFNRADYYKMFSAVFQKFVIIPGTIAMNVAQSCDNIDMERVKACIDKAGLTKKVESLADGYETYLGRQVYENAIMLSGGETQRLMLARALYKDAPFIVLDEPTAALDPIAESDMYMKYNELTEKKSSVYISHRLASTRFCDRIIMLGNGGIIEEGTHDELLKLGGEYARLYEVQSRYYRDKEDENIKSEMEGVQYEG